MSNDLISRKALMEEIDSLYMNITGLRAGKGVLQKYMEEYKKSVLKCIEEAQTAYDVDAVCKELLSESICAKAGEEIFVKLDRAMDIVRNGGKRR